MFTGTARTSQGVWNLIAIAAVSFVILCGVWVDTPTIHAQEIQAGTGDVSNIGMESTSVQQHLGQIEGFIYSIFTGVGTFFLTFCGNFFDAAIGMLIIGMGSMLNSSGLGEAVNNIWLVIRDMFNILFIFGLIYLGLKTIWNASDTNTRRSLGLIIAAALLINFSLYATQLIVDFTNITAMQIYELMDAPETDLQTGTAKGISYGFLQATDLQTYADNAALIQKDVEDPGNLPTMRIIAFGLMMMIFMLITAFVFAAGGILVVIRFAALILFMIASPLIFVGWIIPQLSDVAKKWWNKFLSQALFAPAFLFMLYLSLTMLKQLQTTGSFAAALENPAGGAGFLQIVVYFGIVIAFMIASLIVSQKLGAVGANQSVKVGRSIAKRGRIYAGRAAKGAGGFAGRRTIGRLSSKAQKGFENWQAKPEEKQTKGGRITRNLLSRTNLDRNIIETTEKGKNAKFGGKRSFKEDQEYESQRRRRLSSGAAEQRREDAIRAGIAATQGENAQNVDPQIMKDFADAMKNLTDKQLTDEDSSLDLNTLDNKNVAIHLNEKQLETLQKSGKYSDAELGQIKKARGDGFKEIAKQSTEPGSAYNPARTPEWLAQKGDDEMAKMPIEIYVSENMAPHLTPGAVETKLKSGGVSEEMREQIRKNINQVIANDQQQKTYNGRYAKQWQKWSDRSPIGAHLGLSFSEDES